MAWISAPPSRRGAIGAGLSTRDTVQRLFMDDEPETTLHDVVSWLVVIEGTLVVILLALLFLVFVLFRR